MFVIDSGEVDVLVAQEEGHLKLGRLGKHGARCAEQFRWRAQRTTQLTPPLFL